MIDLLMCAALFQMCLMVNVAILVSVTTCVLSIIIELVQ